MKSYKIIIFKSTNLTKLDVAVRVLQRAGYDWNDSVISVGMNTAPKRNETTDVGVIIKANGAGTIFCQLEELKSDKEYTTVCTNLDSFIDEILKL